jgi:hypothetical protein
MATQAPLGQDRPAPVVERPGSMTGELPIQGGRLDGAARRRLEEGSVGA